MIDIRNGNNIELIKTMEDNSVDSIITDPPYGIHFLGKDWDKNTGADETYEECFRVLKPGGYILAFSATRTVHHLAMAIENAGFQIRDQITWIYGSGFPKGQNIGKTIDEKRQTSGNDWAGFNTNLKPASEPIVMAQKPREGTYVNNVETWGVGALDIDGSRVAADDVVTTHAKGNHKSGSMAGETGALETHQAEGQHLGRYPSNVIMDGSDVVIKDLPDTKGGTWNTTGGMRPFNNEGKDTEATTTKSDNTTKSAAKFFKQIPVEADDYQKYFYCAKVNKKERNIGMDPRASAAIAVGQTAKENADKRAEEMGMKSADARALFEQKKQELKEAGIQANTHPTVKPAALMTYLINLVTPKHRQCLVLDPFCGSGSTGMAAKALGHSFIGCELNEEYCDVARKRIAAWSDKDD